MFSGVRNRLDLLEEIQSGVGGLRYRLPLGNMYSNQKPREFREQVLKLAILSFPRACAYTGRSFDLDASAGIVGKEIINSIIVFVTCQ
jgi:hypothetical protein